MMSMISLLKLVSTRYSTRSRNRGRGGILVGEKVQGVRPDRRRGFVGEQPVPLGTGRLFNTASSYKAHVLAPRVGWIIIEHLDPTHISSLDLCGFPLTSF
jgi:hypothetical protein